MALRNAQGPQRALSQTLERLTSRGPPLWQELAQALMEQKAFVEASAVLEASIQRFPAAPRLRLLAARARLMNGALAQAQSLAEELIAADPTDQDALWLLADAQCARGYFCASTATAVRIAGLAPRKPDTVVASIEWTMSCTRETEAMQIAERALADGVRDTRLFALAGQLALVLGRFDDARRHLLAALDAGVDLNRWFLLQALSMTMRYADSSHPDFERCEKALADARLHPIARASVRFGRAKLFADTGDLKAAVSDLREANALCRRQFQWSNIEWGRFVDRRTGSEPRIDPLPVRDDIVPIFIVGLPRSGTSLVAERLNRDPQVRNRGESGALPYIAEQVFAKTINLALQSSAAEFYYARARQDDDPVKFYVDKNPVNFRFLDHVARLFPQARVIYCRRNLRDTAISIFAQYFANPANGFAYDFADIAAYAEGAERLLRHWQKTLPLAIHCCDYERLVDDPDATLSEVRQFAGLPEREQLPSANSYSTIATASAWQARQPVYRSSVGRWQLFAPYLPELTTAIPDATARA